MNTFRELLSPSAARLLSASGAQLINEIGFDVVRGVVFDVLTGRNLRDSTEMLTRRRIAALNLELATLFFRGSARSDEFLERLPGMAADVLASGPSDKAERWVAQWILGLTDKAVQNVLRDNPQALGAYRDQYIATCQELIASHSEVHGDLSGEVTLGAGLKAQINWLLLTYLLNSAGAQTLAIRGSEKSTYGKLFGRLVLGALLHILGFDYVSLPTRRHTRVFWLSSQRERRESDATLLYRAGKGVRFDLGFIGRGNPEISLDKVSRFERETEFGRSRYYMATMILVDRIGPGSRIQELAKAIEGTIIQMSAGYWPQLVAQELHRVLGFNHPLVRMGQSRISGFLKRKLARVPLQEFL